MKSKTSRSMKLSFLSSYLCSNFGMIYRCVVGGVACFAGTEHMESARACSEGTSICVFNKSVFSSLASSKPTSLSAGKTSQILQIAINIASSLAPLVTEFTALGMERGRTVLLYF